MKINVHSEDKQMVSDLPPGTIFYMDRERYSQSIFLIPTTSIPAPEDWLVTAIQFTTRGEVFVCHLIKEWTATVAPAGTKITVQN